MEPKETEAVLLEESRRMLHELRAHRIELEMQNDELRWIRADLEVSRARYFDLYNLTPVGYFTFSEKGTILEANLTAATLLGAARNALINQPITRFILKEDQDIYYLHRKRLLETGEPQSCELWIVKKDGAQFYARIQASVAKDAAGASLYLAVISDLTEHLRAEKVLLDKEQRHRTILRTTMDGFWVTDMQGHLLEVNETYCRMSGYSMQELLTMRISDLEVAKTEDDIIANILKNMTLGEKRFESRHRCKDGRILDVEVSAMYQPEEGGRHVAFLREITERKRAEAERERLRAAIEHAGETIFITDPAGIIQYVNPAFERVTGYTRDEVVGQTPNVLNSGEQDQAFYRNLWTTIATGRTWKGNMVNKRKDGTLYTEEATISPVLDVSGRIVNFVAVKHDITEHLKLTAQYQHAQKMESVGRLAGGVAHDFNNILSVILGFTEMALEKVGTNAPIRKDLGEILAAARRSRDITRQLLAFARKEVIAPQVLDLNETIEETLKMLHRLIGEDIDLAWLPGAGTQPIRMDPSQLDQILANLCVNARDAISDVGKIIIQTNTVTFDEEYCADHAGFVQGDFMMLSVSDNGCGMDKETQEIAFEPFFTTKAVGRGTGLGLATVYGIVKQNNGFINVYSEPGHGTTFKLYFPRCDAEHTPRELQKDIRSLTGTETILVVEDEEQILRLCRRALEVKGYSVVTVDNPDDAVTLFEKGESDFHLLITDVVMPSMNGNELHDRIKGTKPDIRVLYMSGYTADVITHRGVLPEGVHFIQKPFSTSDMVRKVREVLDYKK